MLLLLPDFVRAAFFQASAPQQDAGEETVLQCFQILNNFDIPLGVEFPSGQIPVNIPVPRNGRLFRI